MSGYDWSTLCRCGHRYGRHIAYGYLWNGKPGCMEKLNNEAGDVCACARYVEDTSDADGVEPGSSAAWDRMYR